MNMAENQTQELPVKVRGKTLRHAIKNFFDIASGKVKGIADVYIEKNEICIDLYDRLNGGYKYSVLYDYTETYNGKWGFEVIKRLLKHGFYLSKKKNPKTGRIRRVLCYGYHG